MYQPIQPQFKIRVYPRGSRPSGSDKVSAKGLRYSSGHFSSYMDIEDCAAFPITYEASADLISRLTFSIDKHADVLLHRMYLGMWVVFYGGYYDENGSGMCKVFSGTITRIVTTFPDNGKVSFNVECMGYQYNQMGKNTYQNYVYPDPNSTRNFAKGRETISLVEIIKGIVEECGMQIGELVLPPSQMNKIYTLTEIKRQKNLSDWNFLLSLAKENGCSMWTDMINGAELLYFVDKNVAVKTIDDSISFVYPLQGDKFSVKGLKDSEIQRFSDVRWNRPRIMRNVTVTEDISSAYAVTRASYDIDPETGEIKNYVSEIKEEEGKKVIYMYELDEAKVAYIDKTNPELADRIRNSGATEWAKGWSSGVPIEQESPEYARYYYKEVKHVDEGVAVFDRAWFGIEVAATVNQDLKIRSQRSYKLRGILRYDTSSHTDRYFLRSLRHIWDVDGTSTELDFIR